MGQKEVATLAALGGISAAVVYSYLSSRPKGTTFPSSKTMRRLLVSEPNKDFEQVKVVIEQTEIPKPKFGQVLVKMEAVPVVRPMWYYSCRMHKKILQISPSNHQHRFLTSLLLYGISLLLTLLPLLLL